jgi:hypothetical protein
VNWEAIGAVGQALGALATAIAVGVSLWLATHGDRDRLKIQIYGQQRSRFYPTTPAPGISIRAVNVGRHDVTITGFVWRFGIFRQETALYPPTGERRLTRGSWYEGEWAEGEATKVFQPLLDSLLRSRAKKLWLARVRLGVITTTGDFITSRAPSSARKALADLAELRRSEISLNPRGNR